MPALHERLGAVIAGGRYILGPEVEAFEREFAAYLGAEHCIGVANGTDALTIALRALGVQPGDEVICPSLTFYATAEAIVNAGAGRSSATSTRTPSASPRRPFEPRPDDRTRAIVPVHLFGNVAPVPELRGSAAVLEDVAQAAGAR